MKRLLLALAALLASAAPAAARQADGVKAHAIAPAALDPAKAYLLYRSSSAKSGLFPITQILVRVPSEAEMAAFRTARQEAYDKALPKLREKAKGDVDAFDIRKPQPTLMTDFPRLRAGGVGGQFWSVYVPGDMQKASGISPVTGSATRSPSPATRW